MSDTIRDGGPAFPVVLQEDTDCHFAGLTIRDYFAAQVLPAICALNEREGYDPISLKDQAEDAYRYADEMIAARERKP